MPTSWYPTAEFPTEYGQSRKECEEVLECQREHREHWVVIQYKCNHSAFNGGHRTPSDYSEIACAECRRRWRTKARYADELPRSSTWS